MTHFITTEGPVVGFLFVPKATVCGVMCLSCALTKDSALGKQVFFLPLDTELLTHVNPKAVGNQGRSEDTSLFHYTETPWFKAFEKKKKKNLFATPKALSFQNLCIC